MSLRLPAGGRVAVTGSSGAGKSSLVTALLRYWPLEGGTLSLGGTDVVRLRQADVRAACALADQRAQLFAGTVRSNLILGRPDATDEAIADALARRPPRRPGWPHFPTGSTRPSGEDGVALSGGERRRLAVARALLAPGPVLVLDEPTSGLDPALADELMDGVFAAAGDRSVLVITHRAARGGPVRRRGDARGRAPRRPTLSPARPHSSGLAGAGGLYPVASGMPPLCLRCVFVVRALLTRPAGALQ